MNKNKLYGAILGDIAGKKYEYKHVGELPEKHLIDLHPMDSSYSDDTIMTLASARSLMYGTDIEHEYKYWANRYELYGFGKGFLEWCKTPPGTINDSWANGCLMRISPFIWEQEFDLMRASIATSHNHEDSYYACKELYGMYNHSRCTITRPKVWEEFEVRAIPTIRFVKQIFHATSSTQEAVKLAISCGGDTDTTASIVAELSNYHRNDLTKEDVEFVEMQLSLELLTILKKFNK
jgi:ADP-ribosylglycohydrolase